MTIYFVDEDYFKFEAWILDLKFRGYEVVTIGDADRAFSKLVLADDIQWVIIDVMLASTEQMDVRYPESETDGGLETGLALLRDLIKQRKDVFPSRSSLLTNTTNESTFKAAMQCAEDNEIDLIVKTAINGPRGFGDAIESLMREAGVIAADAPDS